MAADPPIAPQQGAQQVPPYWTDPTENVKDSLESERRYQDALRNMQANHDRELRDAESRLRDAVSSRIDREAEIRAGHAKEIQKAEADRINAIRAVDVGAAAILANQVAASAEALRGQVEAARQQTALALSAALEPIQKDIQDLRRAQYEAQGVKAQTVETRDVRGEQRLNVNLIITAVIAVIAILSLVALYAAKP